MSKTSPCQPQRVADFLNDNLTATDHAAFEQHLSECDACQANLLSHSASDNWWQAAHQFLSDDEWDAQAAALEETSAGPQRRGPSVSERYVIDSLAPTDNPSMLGRIGSYEVAGVIGSGGMGVVLKAWDGSLSRFVAIKVLSPHLAESEASRRRFAREAQAAAAVVHPNVIGIHGVAEANDLPYLVMSYEKGASLQKRLSQAGPLSAVEVLRIASQTAQGLAAAHRQGLVHRDIKPANLLLADGVERVVMTDFGLARAVDDASLTRTGIIAGTPQYMSPEQAAGADIDFRSDLFSLGSVMYSMCTGRPPFQADSTLGVLRQISESHPADIRSQNPAIPIWLCQIIQRLHRKDRNERFATADEVADLLERCLAHLQKPSVVPLPAELAKPERRNRWWHKTLAASFAAVLLLVAAWWNGTLGSNRSQNNQPAVANEKSDNANQPDFAAETQVETNAESDFTEVTPFALDLPEYVDDVFAGSDVIDSELEAVRREIDDLEQQIAAPLELDELPESFELGDLLLETDSE